MFDVSVVIGKLVVKPRYVLITTDNVEKEYNEISEKLTKAQLALDEINSSIEFDLDI